MPTEYRDIFNWLPRQLKQKLLAQEASTLLNMDGLPGFSRYFIGEGLADICAGRYDLALVSLDDAIRAEEEYRSLKRRRALPPIRSQAALHRLLQYMRGIPALEHPVFGPIRS